MPRVRDGPPLAVWLVLGGEPHLHRTFEPTRIMKANTIGAIGDDRRGVDRDNTLTGVCPVRRGWSAAGGYAEILTGRAQGARGNNF
jgi:hypothetical protein